MKTDKLAIELVLASAVAMWAGPPLHAGEEAPFPLEATMICAFRPAPATAARTKIFVIRGGGGYFPNLGTVINRKFEQQGLEVVDFRYHQKSTAAATIANAYLLEGGVPITYNGQVIGAVGVSGATSQQDAQVAEAGINSLGLAK
jgi:hypothetical protein